MKSIKVFSILLSICIFLYFPDYIQAQIKLYSFAELVNSSEFVVKGKVKNINCYEEKNGYISSEIKFQISEVLKGENILNKELKFTFLGGTIGNRTTTVLELPHFNKNSESILFLNRISDNPNDYSLYRITGLIQGKFDIKTDDYNGKIVVRDTYMSSNISIGRGNNSQEINHKNPIALSTFLESLQMLLKSKGAKK
ncbi:MAG: hypothetical protein KKB34_04220 [Bacteroidetes bacterium]|nr:hypothetical protein [Bacteroidota bacterium]